MNALICINGDDLEKKVVSAVKQMGLNTESVTNAKEALKKIEHHFYPVPYWTINIFTRFIMSP